MRDELTTGFCDAMQGIAFANIGAEARRRARQLMLDGLAVAVAGSEQPGPTRLRDAFAATPGSCSVFSGRRCTDPLAAARLNGAAMHVLDFEAMWSPANHATSITLPAVLAAVEITGADGAAAMTGFVKGLEAAGRLRASSA